MFDWINFLNSYGIEYVTSGHNVRKDNVGIRCPYCGDDPSYHLGISLSGKGFHCWRNNSHSGKAPQRLITALIGCSYAEACRIVEAESVSVRTTDETFADDMNRRLGIKTEQPKRATNTKLEPLPEFRQIDNSSMCRNLIHSYLNARGYDEKGVFDITSRFKLSWALNGRFAYRIIIPVFLNKKLVSWTGRTVVEDEDLRYRSLSHNPEQAAKENLPVALENIKDTLLDYDNLLKGGDTLVVCEGPFDAIRLTHFGEYYGIRATCLFSKSASAMQIDSMTELVLRYKERVAIFDEGADLESFMVFPEFLGFKRLRLPPNNSEGLYLSNRKADPALLTIHGFRKLFGFY